MIRKPISVLILLSILSTLAANFIPLAPAQALPTGWRDLDLTFAGFSTRDHFAQPLIPLERLLNADGTLNLTTGFSGSVDINGWAMRTGANGVPHFVRTSETSANATPFSPSASPDDANWDGRFDLPGASNTVFALAVSGSHLYVGGTFTTIGTVSVNHLASWDSRSGGWASLANGVDGSVTALAVSGSNLFVGGTFTHACGNATCSSDNLTVNNIAQWNSTASAWSALGSGVNSNVTALAVSGSNLYVGGLFTLASGLTVNHIAQWNGSNWSALGNGVDNPINALAVSGSTLFVGGTFTQACGNAACNSGNLTVNHIAQWNGSDWSALGNGVNDNVNALAVNGSSLYVGGGFSEVCGNVACNSGNLTVNHIAQWNGTTWSALSNGVNDNVTALAVSGSNLYVGGVFNEVCGNVACNSGNLTVNRIAQWNGSNWSALGNGLDNDVLVLAVSGSNLYVGGFFSRTCDNAACNSGNLAASHIAQWNGNTWSALGSGMNSFVNALAVSGSNLYVGGAFTSAGGLLVNHIAQWNGSSWSMLGNGVNGAVQALVVSGSNLFVGGGFSQVCGNAACNSGNLTVNNIAQWNGTASAWSALGSGVDNPINALAVSGNNLYVGGGFDAVCGNAACNSGNLIVNYVALWSGNNWFALGNGVKGAVLALAVSGDDLYVGGIFGEVCSSANCNTGNLTVNHIALWSSNNWFALGNGVNGFGVQALAVSGSSLYVGGFFDAVCGNAACDSGNTTVNNIAQWNGTASAWSALGNGVNSFGVQALAVSGSNLYVGGTFTQACGNTACNSGNLTVNNIAQWNGTASAWSALGSGLDNAVWALAVSESNLYVGGNFSTAGGKPSYFLGRWSEPFAVYLPLVVR